MQRILRLSLCLFALALASLPVHADEARDGVADVRHVELGDLRMYVEIHGEGEPVLLLHGGFGSMEAWRPLIAVLSPHFRVIAPDLRAHGRTNDGDRPFDPELLAEDLRALLDALDVPRAHVVGWSMSGGLALELALRHPARVERLVMIAALAHHAGLQEAFREHLLAATADTWPAGTVRAWRALAPDPDRWELVFGKLRDFITSGPRRGADDYPRVRAPTLVILGEQDTVVKPEHIREQAAAIPHARLLACEDAGHGVPLEKPDQVNTAILRFLTGTDGD